MEIKENVFYVGVTDEKLKVFDVVMQTEYGTTYNSYLIKGKNETALIDTVKSEFCDKLISNIENYVDINKLNYLIIDKRNNYEVDEKSDNGNLNKYNYFLQKSKKYINQKNIIEKIYNYLISNIEDKELIIDIERIINERRKV